MSELQKPRFKVGDRVTWRTKGKTDTAEIAEVLNGYLMTEPIYEMPHGTLVPQSFIIAPKLNYDRYAVVENNWLTDNHVTVGIELRFRDGHGHNDASLKRLVQDILEKHCETN